MASIIPGYQCDIFISYRQKDNRGERWVSEFVESLKTELESTFKEEISVYFDINPSDGLLETHDVDATLREKLRCLVFIPIISQTYCDTKSFAWNYEFCAFNRMAKEDKYGRDLRLTGGNVGSRILPVRIHELDHDDRSVIENELGGILRSIEFIYKSPGVNRPLRVNEDRPQDNLNRTYYRDQINKVANAIKEIINGIRYFDRPVSVSSLSKDIVPQESIMSNSGNSIIVLPFDNFSPEPDQDYFSDGLTEEIITDLSQIKDLLVISRSSAMTFKGAKKKIREIANEVNVQFVLEGSVRKAGNNIRITAQLIDAFNDSHIWAEKYAGTLDDVFSIQEKVSSSVVEALKMKLDREEKKTTSNLKAYDLYLLGRYYWNKRTIEGLELCIKYFEQAVENDSDYALAFAGLADAYYIGADWNYLQPATSYAKAKELALRAISLDDNIAEAYATLAGIADNFEYDYEKAETLYRASIRKNQNYATALQWYADYLTRLGRFNEAFVYIDQALKLDPLSPMLNFTCGFIHYYDQDYGNALKKFSETLKIDQSLSYLRFFMFLSYYHKGDMEAAVSEYRNVLSDETDVKDFDLNAVKIFKTEGRTGFLKYITDLELRKSVPSTWYLAIFYSLSGNAEKALDYIEYNVNSLISEYQYLNVEPSFSVLSSEPRFIELLRKVKYRE